MVRVQWTNEKHAEMRIMAIAFVLILDTTYYLLERRSKKDFIDDVSLYMNFWPDFILLFWNLVTTIYL